MPTTTIRDARPDDSYFEKLGKVLPAELTATYFLIRSFAGTNVDLSYWLIILALVLCVAFYFVAPKLIEMATVKNRLLYCVTFLFWFVAIDQTRIAHDVLVRYGLLDSVQVFVFLSSGLAAIWSFVVPYAMDTRNIP